MSSFLSWSLCKVEWSSSFAEGSKKRTKQAVRTTLYWTENAADLNLMQHRSFEFERWWLLRRRETMKWKRQQQPLPLQQRPCRWFSFAAERRAARRARRWHLLVGKRHNKSVSAISVSSSLQYLLSHANTKHIQQYESQCGGRVSLSIQPVAFRHHRKAPGAGHSLDENLLLTHLVFLISLLGLIVIHGLY